MTSVITIYTDGSCTGNGSASSFGGWAAVRDSGKKQLRLSGRAAPTTNQRMEMMGAIQGLEAITNAQASVDLFTDSQYLRKGCLEWLAQWKARDWRTAAKKPVKNEDLWRRLDAQLQLRTVNIHWVRGHSGNPLNELADILAGQAARGNTVRSYGLAEDTAPPVFSRS